MNKWKIATFTLAALIVSMFTMPLVSSQPEVGLPERYQDYEVFIDFSMLPGVRINLFVNQDIVITDEETTHIVHGFSSDLHWSEMSAIEQTEFLSTTEFHFMVNGEELPLNHIIRYDTEEDYMLSLFYRVFPPRFFKEGNNQVFGQWYYMRNGVWESYEDGGTVKVYKGGFIVTTEPVDITVYGGVRFRYFGGGLPPEPIVYVGSNLSDPMLRSESDPYELWWFVEGSPFVIEYKEGISNEWYLGVGAAGQGAGYDIGPFADMNALQINITNTDSLGYYVNLIDLQLSTGTQLNGQWIGTFDGSKNSSWTVTNVDLSQGFLLEGEIFAWQLGAFKSAESVKIEIFVGHVP